MSFMSIGNRGCQFFLVQIFRCLNGIKINAAAAAAAAVKELFILTEKYTAQWHIQSTLQGGPGCILWV